MSYLTKKDFNLLLLKSLNDTNELLYSTKQLVDWIHKKNRDVSVKINKTSFDDLKGWSFDSKKNLRHDSGKFFSIEGLKVKTNWGDISNWSQPIINQPEIGFLGIIAKEIDGKLYFLMQAKIEPGNVNKVQISPTLQATKSNYSRIHKGKSPKYLDYFLDKQNTLILDQLQSEQGARFLKKRNRNIMIFVKEEIPEDDDFRWMTLSQIIDLMGYDNLVNMDTRTVVSGIQYNYLELKNDIDKSANEYLNDNYLNDIDSIIHWITDLKCNYELAVESIDLSKVKKWEVTPERIFHEDEKYFQVIPVEVMIENREVIHWSQPLIEPRQEGICAFITKKINGSTHFLVQAKVECGNHDIIELAPTVQCLTGGFKTGEIPFLEIILKASKEQIKFKAYQSEEGGRFYHEQNLNMIVEFDEHYSPDLPINYNWMTFLQLKDFIRFNNYVNIQARSLISTIRI